MLSTVVSENFCFDHLSHDLDLVMCNHLYLKVYFSILVLKMPKYLEHHICVNICARAFACVLRLSVLCYMFKKKFDQGKE